MSLFPGMTVVIERNDAGQRFIRQGEREVPVTVQPCDQNDPDIVRIKFSGTTHHTMARRLFGDEYKVR